MKVLKTILPVTLLSISIIGPAQAVEADISHLKNVKFKVADEETGEPLRNRELNIYKFVFVAEFAKGASPYSGKDSDSYITSVTTNNNGIFTLDLSSIDTMDFVIGPEEPYYIQSFGCSSGLSHTKSVSHLRIVKFKPGTT